MNDSTYYLVEFDDSKVNVTYGVDSVAPDRARLGHTLSIDRNLVQGYADTAHEILLDLVKDVVKDDGIPPWQAPTSIDSAEFGDAIHVTWSHAEHESVKGTTLLVFAVDDDETIEALGEFFDTLDDIVEAVRPIQAGLPDQVTVVPGVLSA